MRRTTMVIALIAVMIPSTATADDLSVDEAQQALRRGVEYFRDHVSIEGGYLWRYAADFSEREGEVPASATTAWVQPPGTPSVGAAYLDVYELTGDKYYLEAARETARALVQGQLQSGGWDYRIEFAPEDRKKHAYCADKNQSDDQDKSNADETPHQKKKKRPPRNTTTLDDNTTQAALRFMMRIDRALIFQDQPIHESAQFALQSLLDAQYPIGAWPQRFSAAPDSEKFPVKSASFPDEWSRTYPAIDYRSYYTFNDNTIADMVDLMFRAAEIYDDPQYMAAAERAGDFILLAQLPEPQPGWAQQYDAEMHPAWARKFEPPALTGAESQGVMRTLLRLYDRTGKAKFLQPIPRALAYYQSGVLSDGRLARFYEIGTNTPLYFTKDYQLTYSDDDMPTHYGFKTRNNLDAIAKEYDKRKNSNHPGSAKPLTELKKAPRLSAKLKQRAAAVVDAQKENGAWIEPARQRNRSNIPANTPCINSQTFSDNIVKLARFIAASKNSR
ncbi:Pectic acid lyase [Symmachiella macrocystis]|uniref:Pectic acid lyase n=1 Tax=Symmachiella macrocystis TaxID=2527985 RepID=A0A5C6BT85_9PLAN|nr:pectate lyase [Symmachiella macrocystis]TWU14396.1 Pectic acid lyase [Symmachiella macrocystis]